MPPYSPCHGASFAVDGSPINHDYLQSLARLKGRVNGDMVEVMVNRRRRNRAPYQLGMIH